MQRHLSLLALPFAASLYFAGCLSDSDGDGTAGAAGSAGKAGTAGTPSAGASGSPAGSNGSGGGGGTAGAPVSGSGGGGTGGAPGPDPSQNEANKDAASQYVKYLDNLETHPGCTTAGLDTRKAVDGVDAKYTAAAITGYKCAAKEYALPVAEDTTKPIVILVHGNSSTPLDFESYLAPGLPGTAIPQLSERLTAEGYRTYAVDFRYDMNPDSAQTNPGRNFDHGWAVPILQSLVTSLFQNFPDRQFDLVGFSLGTTIIRDTVRRMHRANQAPFARIKDLVLIAGANHGVKTFKDLCGSVDGPKNPTLAGAAACQLGDREGYAPIPFEIPLNGPDNAYETPCRDGISAFGQEGVCGGNSVQYTTLVMADIADGTYQDEFVSQGSAALNGANNLTVPVNTGKDLSGYFFAKTPIDEQGNYAFFDDHYGSLRSETALVQIMDALSN